MNQIGTLTAALAACSLLATPAGGAQEDGTLETRWVAAWRAGDGTEQAKLAAEAEGLAAGHPEDASAQVLAGLTALAGVLRTNLAPDNTDVERTLAVLDAAEARLARAWELAPGTELGADAAATHAFSMLQRFLLQRAGPELGQEMGTWIGRAREAGPERPATRTVGLWLDAWPRMSTPGGVDGVMDDFTALAHEVLEDPELDAEPGFWDLLAPLVAGRALVFSPSPRPAAAADIVAALEEHAPGFAMAERFLAPFTVAHEPLAPAAWEGLDWVELAAEPEPDGAQPGLADVVLLSGARTDEALWLRLELAAPPDESVFGVNLVLDADGDAETGTPWWGGGGSAFVFDRLVSAWIARDADGSWRGAVGVTDDVGAMNGEMVNIGEGSAGGVAFGFDPEGSAVLLRLDPALLGPEARFSVAVGSNGQWNDDLPAGEGLTLDEL